MRCAIAAIPLLGFLALPAVADVELIQTKEKDKGATTIEWDSSFADFDYTSGDTVTFTVNWAAIAGAAEYDNFLLKGFTPKSKKDPAEGTLGDVDVAGMVTVEVTFEELHFDKRRNVDIGNGHFKLYLMVDKDGDGYTESRAGFGVNLHVEDPQ